MENLMKVSIPKTEASEFPNWHPKIQYYNNNLLKSIQLSKNIMWYFLIILNLNIFKFLIKNTVIVSYPKIHKNYQISTKSTKMLKEININCIYDLSTKNKMSLR
jgi:hypothetical protein